MFFVGSKVLTALISPIVPMEIMSSMPAVGVSNFFGNVHDQPQIMCDEQVPCLRLPPGQRIQGGALLLRRQGAAAGCRPR